MPTYVTDTQYFGSGVLKIIISEYISENNGKMYFVLF